MTRVQIDCTLAAQSRRGVCGVLSVAKRARLAAGGSCAGWRIASAGLTAYHSESAEPPSLDIRHIHGMYIQIYIRRDGSFLAYIRTINTHTATRRRARGGWGRSSLLKPLAHHFLWGYFLFFLHI